MVDVAISAPVAPGRSPSAARQSVEAIRCESWSAEAAAAYRMLVAGMDVGAGQQPDWLDCWSQNQNSDILLLSAISSGKPVLSFPVEVVRRNGMVIARVVGGRHASGSFPAFSGEKIEIQPDDLRTALNKARPDVDLLWIERLAPEPSGTVNPLKQLPHFASPNVALAVDLTPGFPKILERVGRKRRLKRHRSQMRKMEAVGTVRRFRADTPEDVDRLFDAFLAMKADRFRKFGIQNVFTGVEAFWRDLFKRSLGQNEPTFFLHGLEVAGVLRAVTGSSRIADREICEFGSITEDELVQASPGDHLAFENIQSAAERGLSVYDFSVGDEHYKRQWCDIETELFDVLIPVTAKGRVYAAGLRFTTDLKRRIKSNERLWSLVKRLRQSQGTAARTAPKDESDEA